VDYIAQELTACGLEVRLDRWNIGAGQRLWEQIERFIQDPQNCDAWVFYVTQNSLGSEPCKEEYAYALDRALNSRTQAFPVIGLSQGAVANDLIPAGIRTRLYVSLTDSDWKERIKAAAEGRTPAIGRPAIEPFHLHLHPRNSSSDPYMIEVRPRAGTWSPFVAAIPNDEQERVGLEIRRGAAGSITTIGSTLRDLWEGVTDDGQWYFTHAGDEATPTQSYYIFCKEIPTKLVFGTLNGQQYILDRAALLG
jgi:TIR domain-containing protein